MYVEGAAVRTTKHGAQKNVQCTMNILHQKKFNNQDNSNNNDDTTNLIITEETNEVSIHNSEEVTPMVAGKKLAEVAIAEALAIATMSKAPKTSGNPMLLCGFIANSNFEKIGDKNEYKNSAQGHSALISTGFNIFDTNVAPGKKDTPPVDTLPASTTVQSNRYRVSATQNNIVYPTAVHDPKYNFASTAVKYTDNTRKKVSDSSHREDDDVQQYSTFFEKDEELHIQDYNYEYENSEISFYSANESVLLSDNEAV